MTAGTAIAATSLLLVISIVVIVGLNAGCGDDDSSDTNATREREVTPETDDETIPRAPRDPDEAAQTALDSLDGIDAPPSPEELASAAGTGDVAAPATIDAAVPPNGCVAITEAPTRIWATPGIAAITASASGDTFFVALHALGAGTEQGTAETGTTTTDTLHVLSVGLGHAPRPLRSLRIDPRLVVPRIAPPGIGIDADGHVMVAFVDGRGKVKLGSVAPDAGDARFPLVEVGSGADPRFAPAVIARGQNRLVAWTDGSGTPMRVKLAIVDVRGSIVSVHDLNSARMGASVPVFSGDDVFFLDARAGVSPIVRAAIGADGRPAEAAVARPVGTVADPPELAVARGGGHDFGAYTAVGNLATTAVGLVRLDGDGAAPTPLVAGTGYGVLNVAAASAPRAALFAADAPKDTPVNAPREIHVRVVRATDAGAEAGPPFIVAGADGTAHRVAIARASTGTVAVAFESAGAVHVAWLRCDDH